MGDPSDRRVHWSNEVSPDWDAFVSSRPGDVYPQSGAYASVKASHAPLWVEVRDSGALVAGALVLTSRMRGVGAIGYVAKGPLLLDADSALAGSVLDALLAAAVANGVRALVVQPVEALPALDHALAARGFSSSPIQVATTGTIVVDLAPTTDELLASLRSGLRRNVRKAERAGVAVREGTTDELELFHRMHLDTAERNGFAPVSWERLRAEWDVLHPRGLLHLFFTEHDGRPMSGATVTAFGDRVLFRHAGWFRSTESAALRPNDLLHWRIIEWAKQRGFAFYDLGGFDRDVAALLLRGEEPPAAFRSSYSQFKLGFGGVPCVLPRAVWRLVPRPLSPLQPVVDRLLRINSLRSAVERRQRA